MFYLVWGRFKVPNTQLHKPRSIVWWSTVLQHGRRWRSWSMLLKWLSRYLHFHLFFFQTAFQPLLLKPFLLLAPSQFVFNHFLCFSRKLTEVIITGATGTNARPNAELVRSPDLGNVIVPRRNTAGKIVLEKKPRVFPATFTNVQVLISFRIRGNYSKRVIWTISSNCFACISQFVVVGLFGRPGPNALHLVEMVSRQRSENATTQKRNTAENLALVPLLSFRIVWRRNVQVRRCFR